MSLSLNNLKSATRADLLEELGELWVERLRLLSQRKKLLEEAKRLRPLEGELEEASKRLVKIHDILTAWKSSGVPCRDDVAGKALGKIEAALWGSNEPI